MSGAIVIHGRQSPDAVRPPAHTPPADGLVSILVACAGQPEHTRLCVRSLLRHSRPPFELHFLDSGSLDGTPEYLAGVADAAPVRVEVVRVAAGPGQPPPARENVPVRGDFVALLDNDVVVTPGWLGQLVGLLGLDPALGLAAPMSNHGPPPLSVGPVPYRLRARAERAAVEGEAGPDLRPQVAEMERFAASWRERHAGQWREAEALGGGCVLLRREVLQRLGLFPTRSPLGRFDTAALAERVRQAGYRLAVCGDLFVHHFASRATARAATAADARP